MEQLQVWVKCYVLILHILIWNFYLPLESVHQFRSWTFTFLYIEQMLLFKIDVQYKVSDIKILYHEKCCISKFQRFIDPSRRGLNSCYVVSWSLSARHSEFQLIGAHCNHAFRHYWGQWVMNLCCIGVSGEMLLGCAGCMCFRLYWRQLSHEFNTTDLRHSHPVLCYTDHITQPMNPSVVLKGREVLYISNWCKLKSVQISEH